MRQAPYTEAMKYWILGLAGVILIVVGVVWWSAERKKPAPAPVGSWALTTAGCYVPVGNPRTSAPGGICGDPATEVRYCVYEGRQYGIGEEFAASDGCNQCECSEATRSVVCTRIDCLLQNTNTGL